MISIQFTGYGNSDNPDIKPISIPVIYGPSGVIIENFSNIDINCANVDKDVISVQLDTDNSKGILSIFDWFNNEDGTASFKIALDVESNLDYYSLCIKVTNSKGYVSLPSNILNIKNLKYGNSNSTLKLFPKYPFYKDIIERLIGNIPENYFLLTSQYIVPYSYMDTKFTLITDKPGVKVDIQIEKIEDQTNPDNKNISKYSLISEGNDNLIKLNLGNGINNITATDNYNNKIFISVACVNWNTILSAHSHEIYNNIQIYINDLNSSINAVNSARLSEHLIKDLLGYFPDVQSQNLFGTKLVLNSLINQATSNEGISNIFKGFFINTPIFVENKNGYKFNPKEYPLYNSQENFGGLDAHIWIPNSCTTNYVAFLKLLNNLGYTILKASEEEIIFLDENNNKIKHTFLKDDLGESCSLKDLIMDESCFDNIRMEVLINSILTLRMLWSGYHLDTSFNDGINYYNNINELDIDNGLGTGEEIYTSNKLDFRRPLFKVHTGSNTNVITFENDYSIEYFSKYIGTRLILFDSNNYHEDSGTYIITDATSNTLTVKNENGSIPSFHAEDHFLSFIGAWLDYENIFYSQYNPYKNLTLKTFDEGKLLDSDGYIASRYSMDNLTYSTNLISTSIVYPNVNKVIVSGSLNNVNPGDTVVFEIDGNIYKYTVQSIISDTEFITEEDLFGNYIADTSISVDFYNSGKSNSIDIYLSKTVSSFINLDLSSDFSSIKVLPDGTFGV